MTDKLWMGACNSLSIWADFNVQLGVIGPNVAQLSISAPSYQEQKKKKKKNQEQIPSKKEKKTIRSKFSQKRKKHYQEQ